MRCSKCASENRDGREFCAKCGAVLARRCPRCGTSNEPGEDFCGECGAVLGTLGTAALERSEHAPIRVTEVPAPQDLDGECKRPTGPSAKPSKLAGGRARGCLNWKQRRASHGCLPSRASAVRRARCLGGSMDNIFYCRRNYPNQIPSCRSSPNSHLSGTNYLPVENSTVSCTRIIHCGAPSGRLAKSYAPTWKLIACDPALNASPTSAPIGIVHPLDALAVQSNVIGGSQSTYHPLSKL
jgi:hypothetical protein